MKLRRWVTVALSLLCLTTFSVAGAAETVLLEEIGVRYTPAEGELTLTRAQMPAAALTALGTDAQTVADAMAREQVYLIGIQPDGGQVTLRITPKPEGLTASNAWQMTADQKSLFLTQLAREGGYGSAAWQSDGYALFSATVETPAEGELRYGDLSLATLYLDQVYAFHCEIIGREATQADNDLLLSAASRLLRLGASSVSASDAEAETPLTLPATDVPSSEAEISYSAQELTLTLDPIAATIGVTQFAVSGKTAPGASLRYSVGGSASSRIKAEADGSFRFTITGLTGDEANAVTLTAFQDDFKTVATFTVTVDWQLTPLAVSQTGAVAAKTVTLTGLTLPGATVQVTRGRSAGRITVNEDGTFSVTLRLSRIGENAFTLQALAAGYHRTDYDTTVTRVLSAEEAVQSLQKKARSVNYAKLSAKPSAYEGLVVSLTGTAESLSYHDGETSFVLAAETGDRYLVLLSDLLAVTQGAEVSLLGTLTGENAAETGYPSLTLAALIP